MRAARNAYVPLLLILAGAVLVRLPAFFQPTWYVDEGIFAGVGRDWLHGHSLYTEAWDNKPPGIFLVYATGWATGLDMFAVRLLHLGAMLAVLALVFLMARRQLGQVGATVATLVAALLLGLPTIEGHLVNTESFLIVFTTLAMYLLQGQLMSEGPASIGPRHAWPLWKPPWPRLDGTKTFVRAGLVFGVACLFKQVALFDVMAAVAMLLLVYRTNWRPLLALGLGIAAPLLATAAAFLVARNFGDFWESTVLELFDYRHDRPPAKTRSQSVLVAMIPLAIGLPYALSLFRRSKLFPPARSSPAGRGRSADAEDEGTLIEASPQRNASNLPLFAWREEAGGKGLEALFPLWLGFTAVAVAASGRSYPHYMLQAVPPLALVCGMLFSTYTPRLPRISVGSGLILGCLTIYHFVFGPLGYVSWHFEPEYTQGYYRNFWDHVITGDRNDHDYEAYFDSHLPGRLDTISATGELDLKDTRIFVWGGDPWIYVENNLNNPTPYSTLFAAKGELFPDGYPVVARYLLAVAPQYILVTDEWSKSWHDVESMFAEVYHESARVGNATLFERTGEGGQSPNVRTD
jgi:hypothetical protein